MLSSCNNIEVTYRLLKSFKFDFGLPVMIQVLWSLKLHLLTIFSYHLRTCRLPWPQERLLNIWVYFVGSVACVKGVGVLCRGRTL